MAGADHDKTETAAVEVTNLTYRFPTYSPTAGCRTGLTDISFSLPTGSRTVLVGANGAGKTTLLRLLAGSRMPTGKSDCIRVYGSDPFMRPVGGITYLGLEWVMNDKVRQGDISVIELATAATGGAISRDGRQGGVGNVNQKGDSDELVERWSRLVELLDIDDQNWKMGSISDGERRRVQLAIGLVRPWRLLLLDEITADLDAWTRAKLLEWLRLETERENGGAVVYATHVFDNLSGWPTHLIHMASGTVKQWGLADDMIRLNDQNDQTDDQTDDQAIVSRLKTQISPLSRLVLDWLRRDLADRGDRKQVQTEALSYQDLSGRGGYGFESIRESRAERDKRKQDK